MNHLFNLKSMFYFLKNLVFAIFCFLVGFLIGSGLISAKALDYTFIYPTELISSSDWDFTDKIIELENALKETGKEYTISLSTRNGKYDRINGIHIYDKVPTLYGFDSSFVTISYDTTYSKYVVVESVDSYSVITEENLDIIISKIKNKDYLNNKTPATVYVWQHVMNDQYVVLYSSSFDIKNTSKTTYTFNDMVVPNGVNIPTVKSLVVPSLTLKNSFNSGTNAYAMGKITWNVYPGSDMSLLDGLARFKIQYGSNDFSAENVPKFSDYKIYGKNVNETEWVEVIDDSDIYIEELNFENFNSETVLTSALHVPVDFCKYEELKIEFYFDNTVNFYMYVYDDLDNSSWSWDEKYFENYRYYVFPKDKKYAFISHSSNVENKGRVYVPVNAIINPDIYLKAYIYDYGSKFVTEELFNYAFEEDFYYTFFEFDFSFEKNEVLFLERNLSDEKVFFYVPKDYAVKFLSEEERGEIITPGGSVDIDPGDIDNSFNQEELDSIDKIYKYIDDFLNEAKDLSAYFNQMFYNFFSNMPDWFQTSCIFVYLMINVFLIIRMGGFNKDG